MKSKGKNTPLVFNSVSEMHRAMGLPRPLHPLVSLVSYSDINADPEMVQSPLIVNLYKISYKKNVQGKMKYGQNYYDFDEGGLVFVSPNQLIAVTDGQVYEGYTLLMHPDFIRNYPLGKSIKNFGFFSYSANEALHLSDQEAQIIISIFENIQRELTTSIDDFSQDVMISHIEVLLNYSNRFYKRQFLTRRAVHHDLIEKLDTLLNDYFSDETAVLKGLPSVQYFSDQLQVSPRYLGDMLRLHTGQNAQKHIHNKLIEKAKEILSTSNLTIAEIAYKLGFEHPQSFNKLFKSKTNVSPLEFRQSFHLN
jgi:AraC-like DNA-binding protein